MLLLLKVLLSQGQEILFHDVSMRIHMCTPIWHGQRLYGFPELVALDWIDKSKVVPLDLAVA